MAASLSSVAFSAAASAASSGSSEAGKLVGAAVLPQRILLFASRGGCAAARRAAGRLSVVRSAPSTPGDISEKVSESIKKAKEACEGDSASGECVAAWDEVEELSAAASHARDRTKASSDPLENYCEDNPETDECRTYDN